MSYAQKKEISGNRTVAIIIVALVHALLGYAIVTGLAYNVIKKAAEDLKTFDVEEPPPPPEEPPPPPDMPDVPPPPMTPPPILRPPVQQPPIRVVETPNIPPPPITPPVVAQPVRPPPPPPPPPPVKRQEARSATGNLQGLFSGNDYPASALDNEETGTTTVRLTISPNGRVADCQVTSSSGSRALDGATCRVIRSRARYTPAMDSNGNPTTGSDTARIRWQLSG